MKIEDAWIDDPTLRGKFDTPMLCVRVDEMPGVTIKPENFTGGWTVGKYGPFVKYTQQDDPTAPLSEVSAGDFNVRFRRRFPPVVDLQLFVGEGEEDQHAGYSLPLTRARQLVRKHDPTWRLLLSDKAAQSGSIVWMPIQTNPGCRQWLGETTCGDKPASIIRVNDIDFPLCSNHLIAHNAKFAAKRTSKVSSS